MQAIYPGTKKLEQKERELVEVKLKNKNRILYKLELLLLKVLPMLIALIYMINTITCFLEIDLPILSYIGGMSILPLIFFYISSYVFKFCAYHRMFLHYIVISEGINAYDTYIGIPLSDSGFFTMNIIILGIWLFVVLYLYLKENKHEKHIKKASS